MLAHDIAWALPELRAEAEARMVDTVLITRGGSRVWSSEIGDYVTLPGTVVYSGACEVQTTETVVQVTDAGASDVVTRRLVVKVPMSVTGVRVDDVAEVTSSTLDPALAGARFRVTGNFAKTFATSRRLPVEELVTP